MQRLISIFILLFLVSCGNSDALELGSDLNRGPCITGFKRMAPGKCVATSISDSSSSGTSGTCVTFDLTPTLPPNANSATFQVAILVQSTNTVSRKGAVVNIYANSDTTCAGSVISSSSISVYEAIALAAGTQIATLNVVSADIDVSTTKKVYYKASDINVGGALLLGSLRLLSYTD